MARRGAGTLYCAHRKLPEEEARASKTEGIGVEWTSGKGAVGYEPSGCRSPDLFAGVPSTAASDHRERIGPKTRRSGGAVELDWPEPFGLVMIESMACGTPVIAFRNGAVEEVMEDGVTGFVCDTVDEAVDRVSRVEELSRSRCRERFEERFSVSRMADDYLRIYERVTAE